LQPDRKNVIHRDLGARRFKVFSPNKMKRRGATICCYEMEAVSQNHLGRTTSAAIEQTLEATIGAANVKKPIL
jgi:hypothetical protein